MSFVILLIFSEHRNHTYIPSKLSAALRGALRPPAGLICVHFPGVTCKF